MGELLGESSEELVIFGNRISIGVETDEPQDFVRTMKVVLMIAEL